jgi:cyclophilin family peptidyl-prolyl cis-trans isomerase
MPHTSKKYRKQNAGGGGGTNRTTLFVVIGIIAVIAVAGGYFVLSSAQKTTSSSTATTSSSPVAITTTQNGLLYANLKTSQGNFTIELFANLTPKTVANFVSLAQSGFYNNLVWHRIVKGFVIQSGDPTTKNGQGTPCTWGSGTSNSVIPFESSPTLTNNVGYVAMASTAAGQPGTSQFYVNLANNPSLNGQYAVFGKVISGMNVVDAIGNLPVTTCSQGGTPPSTPSQAMLISVTIQDSP